MASRGAGGCSVLIARAAKLQAGHPRGGQGLGGGVPFARIICNNGGMAAEAATA